MSENPKATWMDPMRITFAARFMFRLPDHDRRPESAGQTAGGTW